MNIIINGIGGRMGAEVAKMASESACGIKLFAGVDPVGKSELCPCYKALSDIPTKENEKYTFIDFSHHSVTEALLSYCVEKKFPVIIATTGQNEEEIKKINEASKKIPVFFSANMSLGVALLCELAKTAAKTMPDADIEIVEKHHNRKLDAPSGTALLIADAISSIREKAFYVIGRNGQRKREKNEIGIHSIRMGNIVGEHEVIIGTDTQTITLKHEAHTRALFAEGAISAARFMENKPAGLYNMRNIIDE